MSDHVAIRRAVIDDLEAVLRLDGALFDSDRQFDPTLDPQWTCSETGLEFFRERITSTDGVCFVADSGGTIQGYLCGAMVEPEDYRTVRRLAELECMYVVPGLRGQRIGERLAQAFLDWSREEGAARVRVVACAANAGAVRFYRRLGFADYDLVLEMDPAAPGRSRDGERT